MALDNTPLCFGPATRPLDEAATIRLVNRLSYARRDAEAILLTLLETENLDQEAAEAVAHAKNNLRRATELVVSIHRRLSEARR